MENKKYINKPDWLKTKIPSGENYKYVNQLLKKSHLHTVCEEAKCPNLYECWNNRTATFLILGDTCTRNCSFCNVKTGKPSEIDLNEIENIVSMVKDLNLEHVVITSVTRDDLEDGGATHFSELVKSIRLNIPNCTIETLIPDFRGNINSFEILLKNPPDVLNHNIETVKRLYPTVRPQANYQQSLELLKWFKEKGLTTKSGFMLGISEKHEEILELLNDLFNAEVDILTIGQYLQPSRNNISVEKYLSPAEFGNYRDIALEIGFKHVESAPLVRSSYHAKKYVNLT
ncbi:MAG: lipoyl synthase [Ignavibacteriales bacterium]|nr:lipoyl synthase [Ignavibacteriales bacterium]